MSDALAAAALCAQKLRDLLTSFLQSNARVALAVPGGSGARDVLPLLARDPTVPWPRIDLTLSDERLVPAAHPDSNERRLREIAAGGDMAEARIAPIWPDWRKGAAAATRTGGVRGAALRPDIVFLGMGEDGHIASLFPHRPWSSLAPDDDLFVDLEPPTAPPRVSLTPKMVLKAQHRVLYAIGENKTEILEKARRGAAARDLPVALLSEAQEPSWTITARPPEPPLLRLWRA